MKTLNKPTPRPKPMTGRGIAGNLSLSRKLVKKAASHDRVLSGGTK